MNSAYIPPPDRSVRPDDLDAQSRGAVAGEAPGIGRRAVQTVRRQGYETLKLVVVAILMAFVIKTFLLQAFYIPSGSMLDTLQINDRVLVEKLTYRFRTPERGEIVVFRRPGLEEDGFSPVATARSFVEGLGLIEPDPDRDLIKRVIGLPGELVEIVDGTVLINGQPLEESTYIRPDERSYDAVRVPGGHYFVLGDNRGNSLDSRFTLGVVPEENIIGRAFVILWPPADATFALDQDYPGVGEGPAPVGSGTDGGPPEGTASPGAIPPAPAPPATPTIPPAPPPGPPPEAVPPPADGTG